ncbi:MAG: hypothetical protein J6J83_04830 [Oscillospiraceae bacterium]|nr:hypothetical protein [Oscillospiraceae bacterium]
MERKYARFILGFCVTVMTGVMLQCMHWELPSPLMEILVPASASPWEQGKLCYWPYLAGALMIWHLGDGRDSRGGHCALLLLMPLLMTALCYFGGIGTRQGIILAWLTVLALGIALYALVLRRWLWGGELLWYTLAILLGIAYLLLTALPPSGGIFAEVIAVPTMAIPV